MVKKDPLYDCDDKTLPWKIVDKKQYKNKSNANKLFSEEKPSNPTLKTTPRKKGQKCVLIITPNTSPSNIHINKKKSYRIHIKCSR